MTSIITLYSRSLVILLLIVQLNTAGLEIFKISDEDFSTVWHFFSTGLIGQHISFSSWCILFLEI